MRRRALALLAAALPALAAAGVRPAYGGTIRIGLPPGAAGPGDSLLAAIAERAAVAPLLRLDGAGRLVPCVLSEVPRPEAGGRAFRLRVRPGLTDAAGDPLGAAGVAARLGALLQGGPPPPHGWVALPIRGAEAVLEGRAQLLAGVQVLSPYELLVTLAFPLPEFPYLLATTPAGLPGAGPFVPGPSLAGRGPLVLTPNARAPGGRPFARAVELHPVDARGAARLLERGALDLVLRPEAAGGRPGPPLPALTVTVAAVSRDRLGAAAEPVRAALAALDRGELARRFVRGAATPLATLVPPAVLPGAPEAGPDAATGRLPSRLALLASSAVPDQRGIAERIQVKLFDRGVRASVEFADPGSFEARLRTGAYDVALVTIPVLAPVPALAAAQVAWTTRGAAAARRAMEALSGAPSREAALAIADRLARELAVVPLVASGPRASLGAGLQGIAFGADGTLPLGDLWLLGGGTP